ncbi:MAG: hypothetical protein K0R26_1536 [Bacteroidota bacterium]|jgi:hypothetical protein|nr:hypothetical protein [Bacteroidota bacterium]
MKVSEFILKWCMRLYPPLLMQRIWIQNINDNFKQAKVKVIRSVFTMNFGKAVFGGTLYAATDPFYAMLLGQILLRRHLKISIWVRSAKIQFIKPAQSSLYYNIHIPDEEIEEIVTKLDKEGFVIKTFTIRMESKNKILHVIASNELFIRKL